MRIIVACIIVLVTVLAAVMLTRIDFLNPPTSVAETAPPPKPSTAPKPAPPADPVSTITNVEPVSTSTASVTSAPAGPESTSAATPPVSVVAADFSCYGRSRTPRAWNGGVRCDNQHSGFAGGLLPWQS